MGSVRVTPGGIIYPTHALLTFRPSPGIVLSPGTPQGLLLALQCICCDWPKLLISILTFSGMSTLSILWCNHKIQKVTKWRNLWFSY